jgi:quaternary ammonium compound-resistance protein SugE
MAWITLFFAGIFEIIWAVALKYSQSLSKFWPSVITISALAASMLLLGISMRNLPLGTAYAVWTGIGAAGAFIAGIILFGEPVNLMRIIFASLIIIGILGLKFTSQS